MLRQGKIMGDVDDGRSLLVDQVDHEVENLGPDRHVEH